MFDLKNIRTATDNAPEHYLINEEGLKKAVDMAIWLQKPLLLTGAPGTGKTQLASKVAYELSKLDTKGLNGFAPFAPKPLIFDTKTTCSASDLFYTYDAIGHFQKRHIDQSSKEGSDLTAHAYIKLNALGRAILQTYGKKAILADPKMSELQRLGNFDDLEDEPKSSVVLIDEIDKAPRDFPNDLLNEIENYQFTITELNKRVHQADPKLSPARIIVFMTSNFEKNLPDAFLRRCLFYHIPSPTPPQLLNIVCSRMKPYLKLIHSNGKPAEDLDAGLKAKFEKAIDKFEKLKTTMIDKQPSTSELLEWIKVLEVEGFFKEDVDFDKLSDQQKIILDYTLPIIAKSKEDHDRSARNQ